MAPYYVHCSDPDCNFSSPYQIGRGKAPDDYCARCGGETFKACPHCKNGLIDDRNARFCVRCGKRLKPEPKKKPAAKRP